MLYETADAWKRDRTVVEIDAVDRLLRGTDRIAPVAHAEGDQVLTWLAGGAGAEDAPSDLDAALDAWCDARLADRWADVRATGVEVYAAKLIDVFNALPVANLPQTKACVRDRIAEFDRWCADLAEHASRDVRAILYDALTEIQTDRRFLSTWYRFCEQAGRGEISEPDNYLQIALLGLRKLPVFDGTPGDTLRPEALTGLARYGRQLAGTEANHRAFLGAWCTVTARHRDAAETHADQIAELIRRHHDKPFAKWWAGILGWAPPARSAAPVIEPPSLGDLDRVVQQLKNAHNDAIANMVAPFRAGHEYYANATGDSYYLLPTFNRIGNTILNRAPDLARQLAETALTHDASDEHSWALWSDALVALGRKTDAEAVLWEAQRRLIDRAHVRVKLGDLLVSRGRQGEAEWVYRETMRRFPDNPAPPTALADVLAKSGDTGNAIEILGDAVARFPEDAYARTLLARVLIDVGQMKEGERRYRDIMAEFPENRPARLDLGLFLLSQGRDNEAEAILGDLQENAPDATEIKTLQHWLEKSRAGHRYEWRPLDQRSRVGNGGRSSDWAEYAPVEAQVSRALFFAEAPMNHSVGVLTQDDVNELRVDANATLTRLQRDRPHNPVVRLVALRRQGGATDAERDVPAPRRSAPAPLRLAWARQHGDVGTMDGLIDDGGAIAPIAAVARLACDMTDGECAAQTLVALRDSSESDLDGVGRYVRQTLIALFASRPDALANPEKLLDVFAEDLVRGDVEALDDLVDAALLSVVEDELPFPLMAGPQAEAAPATA